MSVAALNWVLRGGPDGRGQQIDERACTRVRVGPATVRLVLVVLADYADRDGRAYPARRTVAGEVAVHPRNVQKALEILCECGLVDKVTAARGPGHPAVYQLRMTPAGVPSLFDEPNVTGIHVTSDRRTRRASTSHAERQRDVQRDVRRDVRRDVHPRREPEPEPEPFTRARVRDDLWDAFAEVVGRLPATGPERGMWNKAAKQLREVDATGDDVRARAGRYRDTWPTMELTPAALVKNWSRFDGAEQADADRRRLEANALGLPVDS